MAWRSRARRSSCSGQTSVCSQAIASGSVTSSGFRSMPPRQATSGRAVGSGIGPVTSQASYGAGPRERAAGRHRPCVAPAVREEVQPGTGADLEERDRAGRHREGERRQQRGQPPDLVGLGRAGQDRRADRAVVATAGRPAARRTARARGRRASGRRRRPGWAASSARAARRSRPAPRGRRPRPHPTRRSTVTPRRPRRRTGGTARAHRRTAPRSLLFRLGSAPGRTELGGAS